MIASWPSIERAASWAGLPTGWPDRASCFVIEGLSSSFVRLVRL